MPAYSTTPFKPLPALLQAGTPQYVLGSFNDRTGPTKGYVISNSAVTTTATLVFQITEGNIPLVGSLISVVRCVNSANFNVTNVALLTVSTTTAGVCTVTYTITSTTQSSTPDSGAVIIPQPEVGETCQNESSVAVAMPYGGVTYDLHQALTVVCSFPSLPTTATVVLQQAVQDQDSEYATVATVATVTGGAVSAAGAQITVDPTLGRFFRLNVSGVTGGSTPTIVGKLLI